MSAVITDASLLVDWWIALNATVELVAEAWTFFDRLNAGDVPGALERLAGTSTWWIQSTGEVLPRSEFAEALTRSMHECPRSYRLTAAHPAERTVIFEIECRGQVVATRKPWISDSCFIVVLGEDGRITSVREYFDTQRIAWATTHGDPRPGGDASTVNSGARMPASDMSRIAIGPQGRRFASLGYEDTEEIYGVLKAYGRLYDDDLLDDFLGLFTQDAVFFPNSPGSSPAEVSGKEAIADFFRGGRQVASSNGVMPHHYATNMLITSAGDHTAEATVSMLYAESVHGKAEVKLLGQYDYALVKQQGRWFISRWSMRYA